MCNNSKTSYYHHLEVSHNGNTPLKTHTIWTHTLLNITRISSQIDEQYPSLVNSNCMRTIRPIEIYDPLQHGMSILLFPKLLWLFLIFQKHINLSSTDYHLSVHPQSQTLCTTYFKPVHLLVSQHCAASL